MTDRINQLRAATLALLMVTSLFAVANVATAAPGDPDTYAVKQGGECWEVTPMGDGTQNVSDFYDYRHPNSTTPANDYASHGTDDIQENQVSQLFLYNGSEGVSLVMLHDKRSDGPHGSTITFDISGLPADRDWVVEDDDYGEDTDDNFSHSGTQSTIDWVWAKHRTDGAAVRGLESNDYNAVQINPGFNEDANRWDTWPYAGDADNRTQAWKLIQNPDVADSPGDKVEFPSMTQSVTIEQGACEDTTSPVAQANVPDQVVKNSTFEVDGSASSDNGQIASYEWDFGDNTTKTGVATSHSYAANGTYNVTLTVTDASGNTNSTTEMVTVTDNDTQNPTAVIDAPGSATVGQSVTLDASDSSDDGNIAEYRWDFNGDGTIDANTSSATTQHSYDSTGDYNATVTVVDSTNKTDSAMQTITVQQSSDQSPTADFDAPSSTHVKANFTVDASASTDPDGQIVSYKWDFGDGKPAVNGKNVTYAYDGTGGGTYTITLTVRDNDGNKDTTSKQISVGDNPPSFGIKTYPSSGTVDAGDKIWVSADPHGDDDGIVDYHFEWGDGTVTEETNGPPWKGGHVYSSPGTYEVQVTVTDTMGQSVSKNVTLTIADPNAGNGGSGGGDDSNDNNNNNGANTGGGDTGDDDTDTNVDDSKDKVRVNVDNAKSDQPLTIDLPTGTQTGDGLTAYESITVTLIQDGDYDMTLNALEEPPEGVSAPTVESAGFEPLSYLVVEHPDLSDDEIADAEFTFTIQKDRLDALDADASDVQIYRYDDGSWATVDTAVVEETDDAVRFRASDRGLSTFVVAIDRPAIGLADLSVSQDSIAPGESVEITATIENDGQASGVMSVELGVDGEMVDTRDITMDANSEQSITFDRTFSEPGTYTVSVNDQEVEVVVQSETTTTVTPEETPATPDDGQPGFGLVLAALAMLGAALLALRRR